MTTGAGRNIDVL